MCIDFKGHTYSVGDGFCYEGIIKNESGSKYHFVVDCGSQAPNKKACKRGELSEKAECSNRLEDISQQITSNGDRVDLFILTHLHKDHFNGMQFLFENKIPDTIIMPYLYPEERLCLIINNYNNLDENDIDDIEFLSNPYNKIILLARENNPNAKLILVRGNSDKESNDKENNDKENNDNNSDRDENILWGERHEDEENIINNIEEMDSSVVNSVKVVKTTLKGIHISNYDWVFKLFNLEADEDKVNVLKKLVGSLTSANLYRIIKNPTEFKKQKEQYKLISKDIYKNLNNTSILIYHSPFITCGRNGTLITGDIDLNHDIYNHILSFFKNEVDHIGLFSIPHHGSEANWNVKLIENGNFDNTVCFASTHNYYKNRMTAEMMSDLRCHNISVLVVDENRFSEFLQFINICNDVSYCHHINNHYIIDESHNKLIDISII